MANFCTNCGTKLRNDYNFCINCGAKIIKDDNFCTNCGAKLRKDDNFCMYCGTKIDKADAKQNNNRIYKEEYSEKEEEAKKLKMIDEIFESEEIKSKIRRNNNLQIDVNYIKANLKYKLINKRENMSEKEIKQFIKTELEKVAKEREKLRLKKEKDRIAKEEKINNKIEMNERTNGGYCSLNCRHCYEEFFDSGGAIVGDLDDGGYTEYYCNLGHPITLGRFCEDYG